MINLAPVLRTLMLLTKNSDNAGSSSLTAILKAWKVLVEGFMFDIFLFIYILSSDYFQHNLTE